MIKVPTMGGPTRVRCILLRCHYATRLTISETVIAEELSRAGRPSRVNRIGDHYRTSFCLEQRRSAFRAVGHGANRFARVEPSGHPWQAFLTSMSSTQSTHTWPVSRDGFVWHLIKCALIFFFVSGDGEHTNRCMTSDMPLVLKLSGKFVVLIRPHRCTRSGHDLSYHLLLSS